MQGEKNKNKTNINGDNEIQHSSSGPGNCFFLTGGSNPAGILWLGGSALELVRTKDEIWNRSWNGWCSFRWVEVVCLIFFLCSPPPTPPPHIAPLLVCWGWVKKGCCRATVQQLRWHFSVCPVKSAFIGAQRVCPCPAELWWMGIIKRCWDGWRAGFREEGRSGPVRRPVRAGVL